MSRAKYTEEEKIQAAIDYLNGRDHTRALQKQSARGKQQ